MAFRNDLVILAPKRHDDRIRPRPGKPGDAVAVQAGAVAVQKYLGGSFIEVRGRGRSLLEAGKAQISSLPQGRKFAMVSIAGRETLKEIDQELLGIITANNERMKRTAGHQPISALLKVEDKHMSPIALYDAAIKIGYNLGDDVILQCLQRIALNGMNDETFKKTDIEDLLKKGFVSLRPIRPIDMNEARDAYIAQSAAVRSL